MENNLYREGGDNHNWVSLEVVLQLTSGDYQG